MTKIIKSYDFKEEYLADTPIMKGRGFRSLHHNAPFVITWVNGIDDPDNTPPTKRTMTRIEFIDELALNANIDIS